MEGMDPTGVNGPARGDERLCGHLASEDTLTSLVEVSPRKTLTSMASRSSSSTSWLRASVTDQTIDFVHGLARAPG